MRGGGGGGPPCLASRPPPGPPPAADRASSPLVGPCVSFCRASTPGRPARPARLPLAFRPHHSRPRASLWSGAGAIDAACPVLLLGRAAEHIQVGAAGGVPQVVSEGAVLAVRRAEPLRPVVPRDVLGAKHGGDAGLPRHGGAQGQPGF
eukprot:8009089-Pyramimonas_sp.AAC.2